MSSTTSTPFLLPARLSRVVEQVAVSGLKLDLTVGGIPFLLKMDDANPLLRQMVEDAKQQFDDSGQYGEHSFGYWWLRSQASFHGGAGQEFLDTGTVDPELSRTRFNTSLGVYPFEPGKATVPPGFTFASGGSGRTFTSAVPVTRLGVDQIAVLRSDAPNVDIFTLNPLAYSTTIDVGTATPQAMATDGNRLFVAIDGGIVRVAEDGTQTVIATLPFTDTVGLGYAKQRLILTHGPSVYEVDPAPVTPPVALGASELIYTHANPAWTWNVVADGPTAIFLAGFSGSVSAVFSIAEQESGGTLVLGPAIEQATLPTGERALSLLFYVNSLFLLGTTAGLRVGTFTPYAQVVWGPESIPGVSVHSLAAIGSVVHAAAEDGLYWLDLGTPADSVGRYAYAKRTDHDGLVGVVSAGSPVLAYPITSSSVGGEDPTLTATGTLTTSWLTYGTTEPKRAHYITVSGSFPGPAGSVTVESREGLTQTFTLPAAATQTVFEFGLSMESSDAYRVTFTLNQDASEENTIRSYQLKALPEPRRYQQVIYPLMTEDWETAATGERVGYDGFAADRINALENLAKRNAIVILEDRLLDQRYQVQVRDVQYRQVIGPQRMNPLGGNTTLIVTMVS